MTPAARTGDVAAIDVDLGPVPKEVLVGEATGLDDLERIAHIPWARPGLVLEGGNTLRPVEVRRLSRLARVHLWLRTPVLPIHLKVIREVQALCDVTVTVPRGRVPSRTLLDRLAGIGPGRVTLVLAGRPTGARLAPLAGRPRPTVSLRLPEAGLDRSLRRAIRALGAPAVLRVPVRTDPRALRGLRGLPIAGLILATDANRVAPKVLAAARRLRVPVTVALDASVTAEDLGVLRRVRDLSLRIRVAPATEVPPGLVRLLRESAGATGPGWTPGAPQPAH